VVRSELASSRCCMVRGPKRRCAARLPQMSLVALPRFPNQPCLRRVRWKELVKGFAAIQALALQRAHAMKADHECKKCTFCMIASSILSCSGRVFELFEEYKSALERPKQGLDGGMHLAAAAHGCVECAVWMHNRTAAAQRSPPHSSLWECF
jgi:hypothetical protein